MDLGTLKAFLLLYLIVAELVPKMQVNVSFFLSFSQIRKSLVVTTAGKALWKLHNSELKGHSILPGYHCWLFRAQELFRQQVMNPARIWSFSSRQ